MTTAVQRYKRLMNCGTCLCLAMLFGDAQTRSHEPTKIVVKREPAVRILEGHTSSVLAVAFSPDGKMLASSCRDKTIKLWGVKAGKLQTTLTEHTGDVYDVAFSPKGDMLASGGKDKGIKIWDATTGKVIRTLEGHTDIVRSVAFSPDQKTLVSSSVDLTVRTWDMETGKVQHTLKGHTARVMSVAFSPDGTLLASASSDKTARLWDAKTGGMKLLLEGDSGGLEHMEFSPDGKLLVGSSHDSNVRIWDVTTGKVLHTLQGHTEEVDCCAFSPDGKTMASGSKDKTIKFWDAKTGKQLRTLTGHTGRVESLAFSPEGNTLATGGGGGDISVRLWDLRMEPAPWSQFRGPAGAGVAVETAKPPIKFGPNTNLKWKIEVPPGSSSPIIAGDSLFLTGYEQDKLFALAYRLADGVELWRVQAPTEIIEPFEKKESSPAASTPATDGERLVVYFGSYGLLCYDLSGKQLWKHELPAGETFHGFGTGSSPVIADGRVIVLRDLERDGRLLCFDLSTGKLLWQANRDGYKTSWGSACIWDTPAGKQVVVAGGLKLQGYNLKTGSIVWTVTGLPSYQCTTPVVADGKLVYAGWSYGGSSEFKVPSFDEVLKEAGDERLGHLTRAGSEKTVLKGNFDASDPNKDGKLTREEWDTQLKAMTAGKNIALALRAGGTGDVTNSHVAWTVTKGLPYITSPLVYQGVIYMVNKQGRLSASDVSNGKAVYLLEDVGLTGAYASPVAANGHIYLCGLDKTVLVVKAGMVPTVASVAELDDRITASPAVVGNVIYIRTGQSLYAFAEK